MSDQPDLKIGLACVESPSYEETPGGTYLMTTTKDDMLLRTLEELLRAWLVTMSANDIGSDPVKIRLLKEVAGEAEGEPSPFVREVYQEVFLRDVWTRANSGGRNPG